MIRFSVRRKKKRRVRFEFVSKFPTAFGRRSTLGHGSVRTETKQKKMLFSPKIFLSIFVQRKKNPKKCKKFKRKKSTFRILLSFRSGKKKNQREEKEIDSKLCVFKRTFFYYSFLSSIFFRRLKMKELFEMENFVERKIFSRVRFALRQ